MSKITVASLHADHVALLAVLTQLTDQHALVCERVVALEAALAARSTQPAAPRATNNAPSTKRDVQIARTETGWAVWLNYKLVAEYPRDKCADARTKARELATSCN